MRADPLDLFMRKVAVDTETGCWRWTGALLKTSGPKGTYKVSGGYGLFKPTGEPTARAHRWIYERTVGPIADGMTLDHRCHSEDPDCPGGAECQHRACVNPSHLRVMTRKANALLGGGPTAVNAVKTHCIHGHEFTPENTRWYGNGTMRACRACARRTAALNRDLKNPNRFRRQSPERLREE